MREFLVNGAGTFLTSRAPSMMLPLVDPRSKYATLSSLKRIMPCHSETKGSSSGMSLSWLRPIRTGDSENFNVRVDVDVGSLTVISSGMGVRWHHSRFWPPSRGAQERPG